MRLLLPFVTMLCLAMALTSGQLFSQIQDYIHSSISLHSLNMIVMTILGVSVISFTVWVFRS